MRLFIAFLFIAFSVNICAQNDKLLTPQQMKEDANYFFTTLYEKHPNPYYYYSKKEFEKRKDSIYSKLDKPMTPQQFAWIISTINGYLDDHTGIKYLNPIDVIKMEMDTNTVLFPNVKIENDRVFLKSNNREITEINDKTVSAIIQDLKKYFNWKLPYTSNTYIMEGYFSFFLPLKYNIQAPFKVRYAHSDDVQTLQGCSGKEYNDEAGWGFRGGKISSFEIYPLSSIAIFPLSNFNVEERETIFCELNAFLNAVRNFNIKYIFYDMSMNAGGNEEVVLDFCAKAFDIVKHGDMYYEFRKIIRKNHVNYENDVSILIDKANKEDATLPEDRKIFVLQGGMTGSGGDYFCRIASENKLATLVGQPTGEPTTAFTHSFFYTMPHSRIGLAIAVALYDFSEYFHTETLHPDVYWDVNHTHAFTEEELMKIVEKCKTTTNKRTK